MWLNSCGGHRFGQRRQSYHLWGKEIHFRMARLAEEGASNTVKRVVIIIGIL